MAIDTTINTVIVGASAAGLATAACLGRESVSFVLLEQAQQVGARWRGHYDRLHLHTSRRLSGLPYFPMPADFPAYPSRDLVVAYLEHYMQHHQIAPEFGQKVVSIARHGDQWITETETTRYVSRNVVIATGYARQPNEVALKGQDVFKGEILHSSAYKNGAAYRGKSVLVVGFGNSGGEIAIDLVEHGARPALSVRNPVNIVPRDMFGIPILGISIAMKLLPPQIADALAAPLLRFSIGSIQTLGLRKLPYGPQTQIRRDHRIPLLDIGTVRLIREGKIRVFPGIDHLTPDGAVFVDGTQAAFDAVVLATGYRPAVGDFLKDAAQVTDADGVPLVSGGETNQPGLYFCGFYVSPTGMLREIGIEAKRIAARIKATTRQ